MIEKHPYGHFIPKRAKAMIIGSFPIGKFSNPQRRGEIKPHEIDFFFGGEKNLLWKLLGECYGVSLAKKEDVVNLLEQEGLAVGDVIDSCQRVEGKASDSDLYDIKWNSELLALLKKHNIQKVYFTSRQVQKWFHKLFPEAVLDEVLLISPSAQSRRAVVRSQNYQAWKERYPEAKTWDYILSFYKTVFHK
jgi:G:T/U-mismatch repair DNA glycosylase